MQVSARVLGQDYGLTAEEMNYALMKLGYLEGEPGNYSVTEKAEDYVVEKDHHRGCGGYSYYNRYWTTRTLDDSIKEILDITPELIVEVRSELGERRARMTAEMLAAREEADKLFLAQQAEEESTAKMDTPQTVGLFQGLDEIQREQLLKTIKIGGQIGIVAIVAVGIGYGCYKLYPRVKAWWENKKRKKKEEEESEKKTTIKVTMTEVTVTE